ncbi:hypothetical protein [Rhodococcus sp. 077-4]|uniref:hypothetical protein n=1 Tax=Rhodococcus sp. 077-4 TaxID=2789271 RepID=UPI0039F5CF10
MTAWLQRAILSPVRGLAASPGVRYTLKVERADRRFPNPLPKRSRPILSGLLPLVGSGVLAGGAVQLGFLYGPTVEGNGGEAGAAVALFGLTVPVALLAWGWTRLATRPKAIAAALSTVALSIPLTMFFVLVAAAPYDAIVCENSADFCGLGVVQVVPTLGAVVPWTVAGIPGLLILLADRRRNCPRSPGFE